MNRKKIKCPCCQAEMDVSYDPGRPTSSSDDRPPEPPYVQVHQSPCTCQDYISAFDFVTLLPDGTRTSRPAEEFYMDDMIRACQPDEDES